MPVEQELALDQTTRQIREKRGISAKELAQADPHAASVAFGQRMRELRAEHDVSQDKLATRTGIHPTAIGRLERGSREPRLTTILRIARGLQVQPGELLDNLEDPQVSR